MKNFKLINRSNLNKMFFTSFLTISVITLSNEGAALIDGIIVSGFLGPTSLAATSITSHVFVIFSLMAGLFYFGMRILNGGSLARGKVEEMQQRFTMVVVLAFVVSLILTFVLIAFAKPITIFLGANGNAADLLDESANYLIGSSIGCIPAILTSVFATAIQMESGNRLVQVTSLISSALDIVLDLIAVKLNLGVFGIGLASSLAAYFYLAGLLLFFLKKDRTLKLNFHNFPWKDLPEIFILGSGKATGRVANIARGILLNYMIIGFAGTMALSALSIVNYINNFIEIPLTGMGQATSILIGVTYGEYNKKECIDVAKIAHKYSAVFSIIAFILMCVFCNNIISIYTTEAGELHDLLVFSIYASALGLYCRCLLKNRVTYLQAIRRVAKGQVLLLAWRFFVTVPCSFAFILIWGTYGFMASFTFAEIILCIAVIAYYWLKSKNIKRYPTIDEYLALPSKFNVLPQNVIELQVFNKDDVVLTSEQIYLFCKGHNYDLKKSYYAALCFEEIAMNIISHGFSKQKQNKPIDVRLTISDKDLILRIRDCCLQFNLEKQIQVENKSKKGACVSSVEEI